MNPISVPLKDIRPVQISLPIEIIANWDCELLVTPLIRSLQDFSIVQRGRHDLTSDSVSKLTKSVNGIKSLLSGTSHCVGLGDKVDFNVLSDGDLVWIKPENGPFSGEMLLLKKSNDSFLLTVNRDAVKRAIDEKFDPIIRAVTELEMEFCE